MQSLHAPSSTPAASPMDGHGVVGKSAPFGVTWPGSNPVYGLAEDLALAPSNSSISTAVNRAGAAPTGTLDSMEVELENPLYGTRWDCEAADYATLDPTVCYSVDVDVNSRDLPPLQEAIGVYEPTPE